VSGFKCSFFFILRMILPKLTEMKKIIILVLLLSVAMQAQELDIDSGASITLGIGTKLNVVGLELNTAVADFELTGPYSITNSSTPIDFGGYSGISFVFDNSLMTGYKGTIVLNYDDADLNGLDESGLILELKDGSGDWQPYESTTRDEVNNTLTMVFDNSSPLPFKE